MSWRPDRLRGLRADGGGRGQPNGRWGTSLIRPTRTEVLSSWR